MRHVINFDPVIIFSVNTPLDKPAELLYVQASLNGMVPVKQVQGCYKDQLEVSYVAAITGKSISKAAQLLKVWELAKKNNQESILFVDEGRNAMLKYLESGDYDMLGKLERVSPKEAMDYNDAWTRDGSTFYVCK